MKILIAGNEVSLEELQGDVIAAYAKGYGHHKFSFCSTTVQGLIYKINELEQEIKLLRSIICPI